MDRRNKFYVKDVFSWILIMVLGVTYIVLKQYGVPYNSGFFCFDKDVSLPYKSSTVPSLLNGFISYLVPISLSIVFHGNCSTNRRTLKLRLLSNMILFILFFGLITQNVTQALKLVAGRLRPHFLDVCNVEYLSNLTCNSDSKQSQSIFIQDYRCLGNSAMFADESHRSLRIYEGRLSFPSGHASVAFYGMVMSVIILYKARGNYLLISLLQAACMLYCIGVGVSRVNDHKHHTDDVIAGSVLGTVIALMSLKHFNAALAPSPENQKLLGPPTRMQSCPEGVVNAAVINDHGARNEAIWIS